VSRADEEQVEEAGTKCAFFKWFTLFCIFPRPFREFSLASAFICCFHSDFSFGSRFYSTANKKTKIRKPLDVRTFDTPRYITKMATRKCTSTLGKYF